MIFNKILYISTVIKEIDLFKIFIHKIKKKIYNKLINYETKSIETLDL